MADRGSLAEDLDPILERARGVWDDLRGARLFVTGGTGFVGTWLLETLSWANRRLSLGAEAVVLSRDPDAFRAKIPHLAGEQALSWVRGDVRSFPPLAGGFTHVIHAAAETSTRKNNEDPLETADVAIAGTRNVLEHAAAWGAPRMLFTSSGAVYGPQPPELSHVPEEYLGAPDALPPASAYAEGKRAAELLCAESAVRAGLPVTVARLFAFVGPYLPLDSHYAIGNFIGDGLAGRNIFVKGDGTPVRAYLYAADMVEWLLTILVGGEPGRAYNVGSEEERTVAEVARIVAGAFEPAPAVRTTCEDGGTGAGQRYVPSTRRAREELGLRQTVALPDAVERTVAWHIARRRSA